MNTPSDREADHGHLRARRRAPRRARGRCGRRRARVSIASGSSAGSLDERQALLPLPVGRLDDDRARDLRQLVAAADDPPARLRHARLREPLALAQLVRREHGRRRRDRMRQPGALGDARGDADRPVGAGRDDPVDLERRRQALDRRLVLGREDAAAVGEAEARARPGSRSTTAIQRPRACAASSSPSCAGPAPRTRRRGLPERESLSTTPHCRDTTRRCARGPPRSDVRGRQPSSRSAFSVEPMWRSTWPSRSGTFRTSSARLAEHVEHHRRRCRETEMSMPVATLMHLARDRVDRRLDHRLDRLGVVEHVEPVARRMPVAVDRQRLVGERLRDEARHDLLGMLARAVVVERPHDHDRQVVRRPVRVGEAVGARLRRRVRRARVERMLLVHRRALGGAVHLGRRDRG